MKLKNLFIGALLLGAMTATTSCSKDSGPDKNQEPGGVEMNGETLRLKISIGEMGLTRAEDKLEEAGAKSTITKASILILDNADQIRKVVDIVEEAKIGELTSENGYKVEGVRGNITKVVVLANNTSTFNPGEKYTNTNVYAKFEEAFNSIQPSDNSGISKVPMIGEGPITGPEGDLYTAKVAITPIYARIQVKGHIISKTQVNVTRIFLDNFWDKEPRKEYAQNEEAKKIQVEKNIEEQLLSIINPFSFDSGDNLQDPTGCYAYHIFPQETDVNITTKKDGNVKLILELKYADPANQGSTKTEYATFKLATATDGKNLDEATPNLDQAKIYTIDLGKIDWTGDGVFVEPNTEDPSKPKNPEDEGKDPDAFKPGDGGDTPNENDKKVAVIVTVNAWEEVPIIPQN